jgi:beta-lactamase regulating signal transducer with metallopeptidase domain
VIPAYWYEALPAFLWQVVLHASVVGVVFFLWVRHVQLRSGSAKRRLLAVVLMLPVVTAAVPGRSGIDFRGLWAWFDSGRVLAIPLFAQFRLYHVVLVVAVLTILLTVMQEVLPALRRIRTTEAGVPERLVHVARSLEGWANCRVLLSESTDIFLATGGWPGRPKLVVSNGALSRLTEAEQVLAVRHEHAHWRGGRWVVSHALFLIRMLQCHNPVALWAFREYCLEVEVACDADALAGRDPRSLARVLLTIYGSTDRRDVAARSALRKRVDVLLAERAREDVLSTPAVVAATIVLLVVLPWVV